MMPDDQLPTGNTDLVARPAVANLTMVKLPNVFGDDEVAGDSNEQILAAASEEGLGVGGEVEVDAVANVRAELSQAGLPSLDELNAMINGGVSNIAPTSPPTIAETTTANDEAQPLPTPDLPTPENSGGLKLPTLDEISAQFQNDDVSQIETQPVPDLSKPDVSDIATGQETKPVASFVADDSLGQVDVGDLKLDSGHDQLKIQPEITIQTQSSIQEMPSPAQAEVIAPTIQDSLQSEVVIPTQPSPTAAEVRLPDQISMSVQNISQLNNDVSNVTAPTSVQDNFAALSQLPAQPPVQSQLVPEFQVQNQNQVQEQPQVFSQHDSVAQEQLLAQTDLSANKMDASSGMGVATQNFNLNQASNQAFVQAEQVVASENGGISLPTMGFEGMSINDLAAAPTIQQGVVSQPTNGSQALPFDVQQVFSQESIQPHEEVSHQNAPVMKEITQPSPILPERSFIPDLDLDKLEFLTPIDMIDQQLAKLEAETRDLKMKNERFQQVSAALKKEIEQKQYSAQVLDYALNSNTNRMNECEQQKQDLLAARSQIAPQPETPPAVMTPAMQMPQPVTNV